MSISKKGIKLSEEHKQNISEKVKSKFQESPAYNRSGNNVKKPIDRELLYQLYIVDNLSMPKIAKKLNCGKRIVFDNLNE
jgi:transposase